MASPQEQMVRLTREPSVPDPHYPPAWPGTTVTEHNSSISLAEYCAIIVRRRWIIYAALFVVVSLTAFVTWKQTPIYRASLKLQIDIDQPSILPFSGYDSTGFSYEPPEQYLKTQLETLSSRTLATRVIRAMKLDSDPRYQTQSQPDIPERIMNRAMQWLRTAYHHWRPVPPRPAAEYKVADNGGQKISPLAAGFVSRLTVTSIKDSRVELVSFDSPSPTLAAEVLNTLATEYIQMNFETKYDATIQASNFLAKQLVDLKAQLEKSDANTLNQNSIQNSILKREADSSKQIYDTMLQRLTEAGITAGLKSNNIHVVDPAEPPQIPYLPDRAADMLKALGGGLMLGLALVFLLEHVDTHPDNSLKTPDDIDRYIKLPFLGLIPAFHASSRAPRRGLLPIRIRYSSSSNGHHRSNGNGHNGSMGLVNFLSKESLVSEAYRDLRTSVLLSASADRFPKALLVTSSLKGEGKTTTCANLGIALAQANEKVLLVDCDMRNPNIHSIFGLENTDGISNVLSGIPELPPFIQPTKVSNLFVITAGMAPPNPSELIGSTQMKRCLTAFSRHFSHILIDSPPLLAATDARILATWVDGVVIVIKGGETTKEAVIRSHRLLSDVHARILGTMLNNVDLHTTGYYYYSQYYHDRSHDKSKQPECAKESEAVH